MSEYILTHKHHTHTHSASGCCIHCGVEVTELSTNKQHTLPLWNPFSLEELLCSPAEDRVKATVMPTSRVSTAPLRGLPSLCREAASARRP
jgi:hypothetical protein